MNFHDAWQVTPGQHQLATMNSIYSRSYWDRLTEPYFLVPFIAVVATFVCGPKILSNSNFIPQTVLERIYDGILLVTPSSLLFAIDDYFSIVPNPRPPSGQPDKMLEAKRVAMKNLGKKALPSAKLTLATVSPDMTWLSWLEKTNKPPGLHNHSNSCFQNSTIQALAGLESLQDYLVWIRKQQESGALGPAPHADALGQFIGCLLDPSNFGETLTVPQSLKALDDEEQQDAQEYFVKFTEGLEANLKMALVHAQRQYGLQPQFGLCPCSFRVTSPDSNDNIDNNDANGNTNGNNDSGDGDDMDLSSFGEKMTLGGRYSLPFMGYLGDQVTCTQCGYSLGVAMNSFSSLSLDPDSATTQDLSHLLDKFAAVDRLENVECNKCTVISYRAKLNFLLEKRPLTEDFRSKLVVRMEEVDAAVKAGDFQDEVLQKLNVPESEKIRTTKHKQTAIARAPASLVLHISRTQWNLYGGYTKNLARIVVPPRLDLSPWMLQNGVPQSPNADENPQAPTTQASGPVYELRSLVIHKGKHNSGHYEAYRKQVVVGEPKEETEEKTEKAKVGEKRQRKTSAAYENNATAEHKPGERSWWNFSDRHVFPCREEEEVLKKPGVAMAFYDRVDSKVAYDTFPLQDAIDRKAESLQIQGKPVSVCEFSDASNSRPHTPSLDTAASDATAHSSATSDSTRDESPDVTAPTKSSSDSMDSAAHSPFPEKIPERTFIGPDRIRNEATNASDDKMALDSSQA